MPISSWLLPVLWREHDWRVALDRLQTQLATVEDSPHAQRAAVELGRAFEYVDPDRRRAIAAYELGGVRGDVQRAHELAVELGAWAVRARLTLAARAIDADPALVVLEAEAWWDAGNTTLCTLALAGVRGAHDRTRARAEDLAALLAGRDRYDAVSARASAMTGPDAADAHVMAARFARTSDRGLDVIASLAAALAASPGHALAGRWLLELALASRDAKRIERCLQLRVAGLDVAARIDGMRACALVLIETAPHRGFGLRVLRQALELAYDSGRTEIPGHLAMWAVLVAHATADGTRLDLLPLVIRALQSSTHAVDRVWLGAVATEISLRDARNPVVAGAYAEIVAEHAPEHPIVRELVGAVATADAVSVPPAAVQAASAASDDLLIDLDELYADAVHTPDPTLTQEIEPLMIEPLLGMGGTQEIETIQVLEEHSAPIKAPARAKLHEAPPKAPPKPAAKPAAPAANVATPAKAAPPAPAAPPTPAPAPAKAAQSPQPIPKITTSVAPKPITPPIAVRPSTAAKPAPASAASSAAKPAKPATGPLPSLSRAVPVLAALRTPDRPVLPPRPATRADALPRARRISIPIDVALVLADGTRITGHSRDISTSGLFVLADVTLEIGSELGVELLLPGAEAFTEDSYTSRGRVARRADGGYGIELIGADAALIAALAAL